MTIALVLLEHRRMFTARQNEDGTLDAIIDDDTVDEPVDDDWPLVVRVRHYGERLPTAFLAKHAPKLVQLSSWFGGDGSRASYLKSVLAAADTLRLAEVHVDFEADARCTQLLRDAALPRLTTLGVRAFSAPPSLLDSLVSLPLVQRVRALRLAVASSLRACPPWLAGLGALPSNIDAVELSFDFGEQGWSVWASRADDGRFTRWRCDARPMQHSGYAKTKVIDLIEPLLDVVPEDAITELSLRPLGIRCTKSDTTAIVSALARQVGLRAIDIAGYTTLPSATPGPNPAATRAAAIEAARERAFAALRASASSAGLDALATLRPDHLTEATDALAAVAGLAATPSSAWSESALAILELPFKNEALTHAALRVLERTRPSGLARRLVAVLAREDGTRLDILAGYSRTPAAFVPTEELPILLDWYESISDAVAPIAARRWNVNESFQAMVTATGDAGTASEIEARLADPARKLTAFKRAALASIVHALRAKKAPRAKAPSKKR